MMQAHRRRVDDAAVTDRGDHRQTRECPSQYPRHEHVLVLHVDDVRLLPAGDSRQREAGVEVEDRVGVIPPGNVARPGARFTGKEADHRERRALRATPRSWLGVIDEHAATPAASSGQRVGAHRRRPAHAGESTRSPGRSSSSTSCRLLAAQLAHGDGRAPGDRRVAFGGSESCPDDTIVEGHHRVVAKMTPRRRRAPAESR